MWYNVPRHVANEPLIMVSPSAKNGDYCVNTHEWYVYHAEGGYWVQMGNIKGKNGKDAYTYAVEAGYSGSEADFYTDIANAANIDLAAILADYYTKKQTEDYVQGYAQPKGEYLVPSDLSGHNTSDASHNDIRLLIEGLTTRLNALADSDDTTLDQLSELVAYIKANRGLIESVTTSKVNVSDIINNLTTNDATKPLSAAQGVALKTLIDAITVPTKLSELSGDSTHRTVTDSEKTAWNAKSNFSGKYADLTGKPTKVSEFTNDAGYIKSAELNTAVYTAVNNALAEAKNSGEFTPIKGTDYWTPADQSAIVDEVITALGTPVFGTVDEENNITITGNLANGEYKFMYETANGELTEIGTFKIGGILYTNQLPISIDTNGSVFNGTGYKANARYSNSSGGIKDETGCYVCGFIPCKKGDIIRLRNIRMNKNDTASNVCHIYVFKEDFSYYATANPDTIINYYSKVEWDADGNLLQFAVMDDVCAYIRLNTGYIGDDSIITVNEEIE